MVRKTQQRPLRAITEDDREALLQISDYVCAGFRGAIDLVLIHNEQCVKSRSPRVTVNEAIAVYSVAAWERFVADIKHLAESGPDMAFRGAGQEIGKGAYLRPFKGKPGSADEVLSAASNDQLLGLWRIQVPSSGAGKELHFSSPVDGYDPGLAELVDWCVELRNKAVHREWPRLMRWLLTTDADGSGGKTINTTTARSIFAVFIQLVDQSLRGLCRIAQVSRPEQIFLPSDWLEGQLAPTRGVKNQEQLKLWLGKKKLHVP